MQCRALKLCKQPLGSPGLFALLRVGANIEYYFCSLGADNQDAEPGARLTCHLLLRLLDESTDFMSHDHSSALKFPFRMSPDHHLLSAAHESIPFGPLLAVFKAMLKLSEAGTTGSP